MITKHHAYTGSRKAKFILDSWDAMVPKFLKVMPIDYKRVLLERKAKSTRSQVHRGKESVAHG
jgi:glutamate synthase domain-containing protein 3